jgi:sialic acid synthase SpsE
MRAEIIAEIGQNHNGDMKLAEQLIVAAKRAGADVAKFQLYDAKNLFPPASDNPWFDYNCATELSKDDLYRLSDICKVHDIEFMASVFDLERLEWLEEVGVKRYKVASRSINDFELLKGIGSTNKPILISLGKWQREELPKLDISNEIKFMHCVSEYPAPLEKLNLQAVNFKKIVGFSDHSIGTTAACAAIVLGCEIIEKHFTFDKNDFGPDHICSMDINELQSLTQFRDEWEKIAQSSQ